MERELKLFDKYNKLFRRNMEAARDNFILINQGGTSSGKTYTALQVLLTWAIENKDEVITVVGQDLPNLKSGAMRDFKDILKQSDYLPEFFHNPGAVAGPFRLKNGTIFEFKSFDNAQDAKSGKRGYLFANEADGIPWEIFNQLFIRTRHKVIVDYNPTREFWAHKKLAIREDSEVIVSTYRDNPYVAASTVRILLEWKHKAETTGDPYWQNMWNVYGLGLTGTIEGVVFPNIEWVDFLPRGGVRGYGLDFGFSNDPTALNHNVLRNGKVFSEKKIYDYGMTANDIDRALRELGVNPAELIVADSSNPQDIVTLSRRGWNIVPAIKGQNSIMSGIQTLKNYELYLVPDSEGDWENERDNYVWAKDRRSGEKLNKPEDHDNHLWDGLRYWLTFMLAPREEQVKAIRRMKVIARQSRRRSGRKTRRLRNM